MPEERSRRAVLVTHGRVGEEMLRACEQVLGAQRDVDVLSNDETSLDSLSALLRDRLAGNTSTLYLFTDLLGGSCTHACRAVQSETDGVRIFTGLNLPMLLEFFHHRDRTTDDELTERILTRARDGIRRL